MRRSIDGGINASTLRFLFHAGLTLARNLGRPYKARVDAKASAMSECSAVW